MNRSIVYIDGLNLYYGAVKDTPWKWLNIERYFRLLRNSDDIQIIKYFTAKVTYSQDQATYLAAIATTGVQTIFGSFKFRTIPCRVKGCCYIGNRHFKYPEEKKTDVNIAIHMLNDAHEDKYDTAVLVSGDSDLVPAMEMVKLKFPKKKIICYVPDFSGCRGISIDIQNTLGCKCRTLPNNLLSKVQFPPRFQDIQGGWIEKPLDW